jgi:stage II sporulation protein D
MSPPSGLGAQLLACVLLASPPAAAEDLHVRVRQGDGKVARVALEPYVERAVAGEVWADWPVEALKAQAVVARTYALHQRRQNAGQPADVESGVLSQRFSRGPVARRIRTAAHQTRGQYLSHAGAPILAAFHASAGGRTASASEVWGEDLPYLRSVESPDDAAPDYYWSYRIGLPELRDVLREAGYAPRDGRRVRVLRRSSSGRAASVELFGAVLSGRAVRELLGGRALRSTLFDLTVEDGSARFAGSGAGHGVGLCQWGARELARRGRSYVQILDHYYPGTRLTEVGARDGLAARR